MSRQSIPEAIGKLRGLRLDRMFQADFLLSWDKSTDEIRAVLAVAEILKAMRADNISAKIFDSGLAVAIFRDKSTRTRFSFAGAADLLGLAVQELDETKSQIAHGETVRETANMISFLTEIIGIRDDMYLGAGHSYMLQVARAVEEGYGEGLLPGRPGLVNLQCDIDHPTQALADLLHLANHFGGLDRLRGKRLAMSWAYSPSYGKPLSVPQGVIGLMTRFGLDVVLAHPPGYNLIPEVEELAKNNCQASGGHFQVANSMEDAFREADIVYPKSWAPYAVMERRTKLLETSNMKGLEELEVECLEKNRSYLAWECTQEMMDRTNDALYLHCLPADISAVSCERGEVAASVFEKFRRSTYRQAGYKPYIIAAMIFLSKVRQPQEKLTELFERAGRRKI